MKLGWLNGCIVVAASIASGESAAGTVTLPSDVEVALSVAPASNLEPGQRLEFTMAVTNHGPESVDRVILTSSPVYNELDTTTSISSCGNQLVLAVVDLGSSFYYLYTWSAATVAAPLAVGESRSCSFTVDYTGAAPAVFPVSFGFPSWLHDLNAVNDSATVDLRRGAASVAVPLPTASNGALIAMAALLAWAGARMGRIRQLGPRKQRITTIAKR